MIEGGIYFWLLPLGRTLVGFMIGLFLAVMGGWMATNYLGILGHRISIATYTSCGLGWGPVSGLMLVG